MFSNEILQKGVPAKLPLPVELNVQDLLSICRNTPDLKEQIKNAGEEFYDLICKVCDEKTADFFKLKKLDNLEVYIDENTLERKLIVSSSNIFNRVAQLTGDNRIMHYDFEAIKENIEKLKSLSEEDFKKDYPSLYSYYINEKNQIQALVPMKNNLRKMDYANVMSRVKMLADMFDCSIETMKSKIEKANPNYNYKNFLADFISILENLNKLSEILVTPSIEKENEVYSNIDIEINDKDQEKLGIYITYVFQDMLKQMKKDYQQEYLYYISEYYFENKDLVDKNKKVFSKYYDKIIKLEDMYEDYKQILINNPELRIVDFGYDDFEGMDLSEINEFMEEYFKSLSANWEFFKDTSIDEETILKIKDYYGDSSRYPDQSKLKEIIEKFIEKKEFFDKTDPYYRILGKNSFDGYIGYIYTNGTVVLEKFFENSSTGKVAQNQAIYVMPINSFQTLTHLSKNEIISQKLCKRFIHKGNWQNKVITEISAEENGSPVEQLDNFITKGVVRKP